MPLKTIRIRYLSSTILLASVLGMFLVWLRHLNYGVGIDPDAVLYISIAENLARGDGLLPLLGEKTDGPAPLFPFILSIIISLGTVDKFSFAPYLGIIAFGLSISIFVVWLSTKIRSRIILLCMSIACALSPLLGHEHATVKADSLFILLVVTSLLALDMFFDSNKKHWIIFAAISAALSFLTRYLGISIIISAPILIVARTRPSLRGVKYAVTYLVITMSVIGLYLLQNLLRIQRLFPRQWGPPFSNLDSIESLTSELIKWIFGNAGFDYLETISEDFDINNILARVVLLVILATFLIYVYLRLQLRKELPKFGGLTTPIVFILVYIFVLYFLLAVGNTNGSIKPRFLAPIYIPFLITLAVILDQIWDTLRHRIYVTTIVGLMGLWLIFTATTSYNNIKIWLDYGYRYSSSEWGDSETIDYLKLNPVVGYIYSNEIRAVYVHSRIPNSDGVYFRQLPYDLPEAAGLPEDIRLDWDPWDWARTRNIDIHVVWFHDWKSYIVEAPRYDFMSLTASQDLQIITVLEDGIILKGSQDSPQYSDLRAAILESILRDSRLVANNPTVNIYLDSERLVYISTLCDNADIEGRFFLHVYPVDRADIFESRRIRDLGFNGYDFSFNQEGFFFGDSCAVIRNLPDYDIEIIRTGQHIDEAELWVEEFRSELLYQQKLHGNVKRS